MALALNISVVQKQLERCLHFPPGIQDWVTDLGNVGEVKESHWAFFPTILNWSTPSGAVI